MCRFSLPFQVLLYPRSLSLGFFKCTLFLPWCFCHPCDETIVHMLMTLNMSLHPGYLAWILNSDTQLPTWHLNLNVHLTPQMSHHCTSYLWLQKKMWVLVANWAWLGLVLISTSFSHTTKVLWKRTGPGWFGRYIGWVYLLGRVSLQMVIQLKG